MEAADCDLQSGPIPPRAGDASMKSLIPVEHIERRIFLIRGQKVMLDSDLARIYGVSTARLNQQVSRNRDRFPDDFLFRLTKQEHDALMLQFATSSRGPGGRRKLPLVFTEHGAIMAASVLNSPVAVQASVHVVRAFVRLRELVATHKDIIRKLAELEKHVAGHDAHIQSLFEAIRRLMKPRTEKRVRPRHQVSGFRPPDVRGPQGGDAHGHILRRRLEQREKADLSQRAARQASRQGNGRRGMVRPNRAALARRPDQLLPLSLPKDLLGEPVDVDRDHHAPRSTPARRDQHGTKDSTTRPPLSRTVAEFLLYNRHSWAVSSAVEHSPYTRGVVGSNPSRPKSFFCGFRLPDPYPDLPRDRPTADEE